MKCAGCGSILFNLLVVKCDKCQSIQCHSACSLFGHMRCLGCGTTQENGVATTTTTTVAPPPPTATSQSAFHCEACNTSVNANNPGKHYGTQIHMQRIFDNSNPARFCAGCGKRGGKQKWTTYEKAMIPKCKILSTDNIDIGICYRCGGLVQLDSMAKIAISAEEAAVAEFVRSSLPTDLLDIGNSSAKKRNIAQTQEPEADPPPPPPPPSYARPAHCDDLFLNAFSMNPFSQ